MYSRANGVGRAGEDEHVFYFDSDILSEDCGFDGNQEWCIFLECLIRDRTRQYKHSEEESSLPWFLF